MHPFLHPALTFPQKGPFVVSTEGAESTHSQAVPKCLVWPCSILPVCQNLLCFPCCHNISAAKSRDNQPQLGPYAGPARNSRSPGPMCNKACVLSTCRFFGSIVSKGKTCLFKHPNNVFVYSLSFLFSCHKLFENVYYCRLP